MVNELSFTNVRVILDRLLKNPLLQDLTLESVIQYTLDFFDIMGLSKLYVDNIATVDICDYRGLLPPNIVSITQVKDSASNLCIGLSTDTFYKDPSNDYAQNFKTYKTQNRIIYTSFKEGSVIVSYKTLNTDKEGYPLIPDNGVFLRALEAFIKQEQYELLFDEGKISANVLQNAQQGYCWKAASCNMEFIIPSLSEMEVLANINNNPILNINEASSGFKHTGDKQFTKIH